jgi:hypothetical protein
LDTLTAISGEGSAQIKCPACGRLVGPEDSFCAGCGKSVEPAELRRRTQIDIAWLAEVLAADGYFTEKHEEPGKLPTLFGEHPSRSNVTMMLDQEQRIINCVTWWTGKVTRWSKGALLEALNRANSIAEICTFSIDNDGDVTASWYIPLFSRMAAVDISGTVRSAEDDFRHAVERSGLVEFIK